MSNPFPIIRTGDKPTVKFVEGEIVRDVKCKNEDEALALANVRPFCEAYLDYKPVNLQELRSPLMPSAVIADLKAYRFLVDLKEDIQSGKIS